MYSSIESITFLSKNRNFLARGFFLKSKRINVFEENPIWHRGKGKDSYSNLVCEYNDFILNRIEHVLPFFDFQDFLFTFSKYECHLIVLQ